MLVLSQSAQPLGQLGDFASDFRRAVEAASKIAERVPQYLDTIVDVLEDPALPVVISQVKAIKKLNVADAKRQIPTITEKDIPGVGLSRFVKPIDAYIYTREHRWVTPTAIVLMLLIPFGIGIIIGRVTKR